MTKTKQTKHKNKFDENALLIGIDLDEAYTQVAYWNPIKKKPEIINPSGGFGSYMLPTVLLYDEASDDWLIGEEAILHHKASDPYWFNDILGFNERVRIGQEEYDNGRLLSIFIKKILNFFKSSNPKISIQAVMFSLSLPTVQLVETIYKAFDYIELDKSKVSVQGHNESFIYFALDYDPSQRKIGFFDLTGQHFKYYQLTVKNHLDPFQITVHQEDFSKTFVGCDLENKIKEYIVDAFKHYGNKKSFSEDEIIELDRFYYKNKSFIFSKFIKNEPAKVVFDFAYPAVEASMTSKEVYQYVKEYDLLFEEIIRQTLATNVVPYVYLSGSGFAIPWTTRALKTLCSGRKVFQSQKLYSKGACYALASRYGLIELPEFIVDGKGIVGADYGIKVYKNGKEEFLPVIVTGTAWYNAYKTVTVVLDQLSGIPIYVRQPGGRIIEMGSIKLNDLPDRPPKATKLEITFRFLKQTEFEVVIKDRGLGKFFPATDKQWTKSYPI